MKKIRRSAWIGAAVLAAGFLMAGCPGEVNDGDVLFGIELNTADHVFPAFEMGGTIGAGLNVIIQNTGNRPTGPLSVTLGGANPAGFHVSTAPIASLPVGARPGNRPPHDFAVHPMAGLEAGTHSAIVTVAGASGSAIASRSFEVTVTVNRPAQGISLNVTGNNNLRPLGEGYTADDRAGVALPVAITNIGTEVTNALTVTSANAAFEVSTASVEGIAVGATVPNAFTVVPAVGLDVGTHTGTITVSGAGIARSFNVTFAVLGEATMPGIELNETSHDFGRELVGPYAVPPAVRVSVTNTMGAGTGALRITREGSNPGSFEVLTATVPPVPVSIIGNIPAGGSVEFDVRPLGDLDVGMHSARIVISGDSDDNEGLLLGAVFNVTFEVYDEIVITAPANHTFPALTAGYAAGDRTPFDAIITNTDSDRATGPLMVTIGGANANAFTVDSTFIASIAADGTAQIEVQPITGLVAGTYTATITVLGNEPGSIVVPVEITVTLTVN